MINRKTTFVGRFHCGQGSRRVSTGTEEVATVIGQFFGRQSPSHDSHEADHFEVLPRSTSMRIVISGPESIKAGLLAAAPPMNPSPVLASRSASPTHTPSAASASVPPHG